MEHLKVRFSALPPEFKFRWLSSGLIVAVAVSLGVFMTFAPLMRIEGPGPQWFWLLGAGLFVACLCFVWTIRFRSVYAAARSRVRREGGIVVLFSSVMISTELGADGLIAQSESGPEKGWLWMSERQLVVVRSGHPERTLLPEEVVRLARVDVLNRYLFEPQLAIGLSDGSMIQAIPVRYGLASIFPFGSRRLDRVLNRLEDFCCPENQ